MYITFISLLLVCFASTYKTGPLFSNIRRDIKNDSLQYQLNLNNSYFLTLKNYHVNALSTTVIEYPWVARVLHSVDYSRPHMCTAVCIGPRLFITAARCVVLLKIKYTSVIYQDYRHKPKAFVLPTNESKQMFDDIGFIIVHDEYDGPWASVQLLEEKRTDDYYRWFMDFKFSDYEHRVIGYTKLKRSETPLLWRRRFYLTYLNVNVDINLCREILVYNQRVDGFGVPCYHSCTLPEFSGKGSEHEKCSNYHGAEGSALINVKTNRLLGIATWGAYFENLELPVGFAIPNSDTFLEDKSCAEKIRDHPDFIVEAGFYQDLCNGKRRNGERNNANRHRRMNT